MKTIPSTILAFVIVTLVVAWASAATMPVAVDVVPVASESRDSGTPIGNIRVRFKDGHTEMWTKQGRCLIAKVTRNGLAGWTHYGWRNRRGAPANDSIRLMVTAERWVDFRSGYPFIDDWDTSADGLALVVRSGYAHGPARFELFDIRTQKLLKQTIEKPYAELPNWAKTLATDQPKP